MTYPPPQPGQDPYGSQPYASQPYGAPQPYGAYPQPYGYGAPQDHPQSTTILVLGILSLVMCGILGPFAWVMGKKALAEIDASGGMLGGRGNVKAGYICGMISSILLIVSFVFVILYIIIVVIAIGAS
ncbi:DUF4190 domain-containing protein [Nocardia cyriacigeorgica]|uniref:DUF4190 domain-containing protein n=1 Tax=Nocardia cyriacigeorgica TaxID=135487 RepID=UPI002457FD98|nr:DUF4190 domain-containing protein [Nocardia cyriacigeorgica]